jgi:molybdate transport system substrate-binding protein
LQGFRAGANGIASMASDAAGGGSGAAEIEVLSAGGFRAAMEIIAPLFERASGRTLKVTYGTPAGTRERMLAGEPFDIAVVVAAILADVDAAGRLAAGTRVQVARSPVGVGVPAGANVPQIGSVEQFRSAIGRARTIGLSDPKVGTNLANELIAAADRLGFGDDIRSRAIFVMGPGSVVSAELAKGRMDLVVTLASEIVPVAGVRYVGPVPDPLQGDYRFDAVMRAAARHERAARAFLDFLRTPQATAAMAATGLEPG